MTREVLQDIQQRLAKITRGDWITRPGPTAGTRFVCFSRNPEKSSGTNALEEGDARFIAAAPNDVLRLLCEVRRLQRDLERAKAIA